MMSTTPGSMNRSAVEVSNPFERKKMKSEDYAPFRAREPEPLLLRQSKLEGDSGAEEAPIFRSHDAPGGSGAPGAARALIAQGPLTRPKSEANDTYTPQIKLLEAMKFLITPLDMPSLSPLLTRIEKKLLESSPNKMIPNNEMILGMAVLVTKITNHSMPIQSESVKSISLREFMCYLKAAIMNSKLEGFEGLLEKIRGRIGELAAEDKNIPAEKVASALQATLEVIGF
ncbi:hypothetical protein CAEBREN_06622 [Caenorhabditis brenneri]|uniref:Uncharacterized protein n=1 Tax=Caenorhabditis brenneri TaxID=135651 RepID=G0NGG4_CAEBE|nr:hypothetical protein CAEBREN_06622 [Caenorhabditis brenneri]